VSGHSYYTLGLYVSVFLVSCPVFLFYDKLRLFKRFFNISLDDLPFFKYVILTINSGSFVGNAFFDG